MKARKLFALVLAGALMVSSFAACGNSNSSSTASKTESKTESSKAESSSAESTPASTGGEKEKSDAKLNIWVYGWEKASADKIKEDTAAYKEETGVEVTVTPIASDSYSTKIQATIAGGNNPDLAFVDAGVQSTQLLSLIHI